MTIIITEYRHTLTYISSAVAIKQYKWSYYFNYHDEIRFSLIQNQRYIFFHGVLMANSLILSRHWTPMKIYGFGQFKIFFGYECICINIWYYLFTSVLTVYKLLNTYSPSNCIKQPFKFEEIEIPVLIQAIM